MKVGECMLLKIRWLLSDLLFECEESFGLYDEFTKHVRVLYLAVCEEMEREGIEL